MRLAKHLMDLEKIQFLQDMQKMSTMNIGRLVSRLVGDLPFGECYLNIGVWHGFTFLSGIAENPNKWCIGVDNFSQYDGTQESFLKSFDKLKTHFHEFHTMDYKDYLINKHHGKIGLYFYDGNHSMEDQFDALVLAEPFFADECLIMVDDTNWDHVRQGTNMFLERHPGRYKVLFDQKTNSTDDPIWWNGLMIIQKQGR